MVLEYADTPDLIASVAQSGVTGFVLRTDMERTDLDRLPVYDVEGEVVVGYMVLAGGAPTFVEPSEGLSRSAPPATR